MTTPDEAVNLETAVERLEPEERAVNVLLDFDGSPSDACFPAGVMPFGLVSELIQKISDQDDALSASNARAAEWEAKHKNCEICLKAAITSCKQGHARAIAAEEALREARFEARDLVPMLDDYFDRHIGATRGEDMSLEEMLISKAREVIARTVLASMKEKGRG